MRRFTIRKWWLQKPLVSDSKQTVSNQYRWSYSLVVMDNIETLQNKTTVAAEIVGVRFEADLFKSLLMFLGFGCHGQRWDVSQSENGCCRNRSLQVRSRLFQISTDHHRIWLSPTTLRPFTKTEWLLRKTLVSDSKQTSSNQYRWSWALAVINNIEMFHHRRTVAAETVGFRFEEDLFKSVPIIIGVGCQAQHWDRSANENGCCRIRWFQVRSRLLQISPDYHTLLLSCITLKRLTTRRWLLQKPLVSDSKQTFSNQYWSS